MPKFLFLPLLTLLAACQTVSPAPAYTAAQVKVLQAQGFTRVDDRWELGLADRLLFASDEDRLAETQVRRLAELSHALLSVGIHGLAIEGNTDSTGEAGYNQKLSERRAIAVKQAIVGSGMADQTVRAVGLGEKHPVESNRTAAGRQENRRVVIVITPADAS